MLSVRATVEALYNAGYDSYIASDLAVGASAYATSADGMELAGDTDETLTLLPEPDTESMVLLPGQVNFCNENWMCNI